VPDALYLYVIIGLVSPILIVLPSTAASDEYVVLNSKLRGLSDQINTNKADVEKIFKKIFDNNFKIICITETDWKNYKEEYKKDKSKFVYKEEPKEKEIKKKTLKDKAKELFEN